MDTCACAAQSGQDGLSRGNCLLAEREGLLAYKPLALMDRAVLEPYIQAQEFENSELTFADMYIWRKSWRVEWAIALGALFMRMRMPGKCLMYPVMPLDGRLTRAQLELAVGDMRSAGWRPVMTSVGEGYLQRVREAMPLGWRELELEDFEDYVYRAQDLITLKGRNYHGKRNHLARFMRAYEGRYVYRPLRACDMAECLRLWDRWYAERVGGMDDGERLAAAQEREMVAEAFGAMHLLGLRGGVVEVDGSMAGFTLGERERDTLLVRLEKALDQYEGIYAFINREFAEHGFEGVRWINREEDMGIPGLRRSKQSYYPDHMVKKYQLDFSATEEDAP